MSDMYSINPVQNGFFAWITAILDFLKIQRGFFCDMKNELYFYALFFHLLWNP